MKRLVTLLLLAIAFCLTASAQSLGLFINTQGDGYTNVRNSANGKKVAVLYDGDMIEVDRCQNGWFHLSSRYYCTSEGEEATLPSGTALWVHSSQLDASWYNDGGINITLRSTPSKNGAVVFKGSGEPYSNQIKSILDYKNSWLKVRLRNGKTGWVPQNIICGNSLTICM